MKSTILRWEVLAIAGVLFFSFKENGINKRIEDQRNIMVVGSADMSIPVDEITIRISMESKINQMNGLENKTRKLLKSHGIKENQINLDNNISNHWGWHDNKEYKNLYVTVDTAASFQELMKDLKGEHYNNVTITQSTNSKIHDYRKEVKVAAIKAAQDKAKYLLKGLNEDLGVVLSITELEGNENNRGWYYYNRSNSNISNEYLGSKYSKGAKTLNGVQNIKLRYSVQVSFAIEE